MAHLAALEINPRFFALRSGKLEGGRGTAHAFELNDVGEVKITQGALKFFAVRSARRRKERVDEKDEIAVREWLFEKMNGAKSGGLFAMGREMGSRENDRPGVRMARPEVVKEFLADVRDGVGVEHEKIRLCLQDDALGLFQGRREIDLGGGGGFKEGGANFLGDLEIRFEDENAPALFSETCGIGRRGFVHDRDLARGQCRCRLGATPK